VYLDRLAWDGAPDVTLTRPAFEGSMWRAAWVNAVDQYEGRWGEPFRLIQNEGTGLLIHGTREWTDYRVEADVTPHMVAGAGLAARVQGLKRYYALRLSGAAGDGGTTAQLVKMRDAETVLAEVAFPWRFGQTYRLALAVEGQQIRAWVGDGLLFEVTDDDRPLEGGAVALLVTEGRTATQAVRVTPIQ
jgi:hypothetical protein